MQMAQFRAAQLEQQKQAQAQAQAQAAGQHLQHPQQQQPPASHLQQQMLQQQQHRMSMLQQHPQGQQQGLGNGPQMHALQQQFQQQQQHQQMNALAAQAGITNVVPAVMTGALHSAGLAGRDFKAALSHQEAVRSLGERSANSQEKIRAAYGKGLSEHTQRMMNKDAMQQPQQAQQQASGSPSMSDKAMSGPHAQQPQGVQRNPSGATRPHGMAFDGSTPMQVSKVALGRADSSQQAESSQGAVRGNTPPDRKRQRRNSGSAAPSPYIQPQTLQAGFQPNMGMGMGQQMSVMGGSQQGRMPMNGGMEGQSPGMPGQSPRTMPNGMPGHSMQRNQSKPGDGSMPPPQSPAGTNLGRKTPQATGMSAMTPKMQNSDASVSV
jgi:hypothetical protein